jgi:acyl dehydratase
MLERTAVGRTTPPKLNEIERGAIRRFAEAVGDTNPLWLDTAYAKSLGFAAPLAPPAFVCTLVAGGELRTALGVPLKQLALSEWAVEYERPLLAGEKVWVTSRVADVTSRVSQAGSVELAVIEDEGRDEAGKLVYRLKRTWVRISREGA